MTSVLIAEDDPAIATLLTDALGDRFATHVVANGALVLDALAANRPDLLILDLSLPGLSGLDVFDLVRNDPAWQGIPVLFLTADPERARRAFDPTGACLVMGKPFEVDELIAAVDGMLALAKRAEAAA